MSYRRPSARAPKLAHDPIADLAGELLRLDLLFHSTAEPSLRAAILSKRQLVRLQLEEITRAS